MGGKKSGKGQFALFDESPWVVVEMYQDRYDQQKVWLGEPFYLFW